MTPEIYSWVVLPIIIFFARVIDVSLGTMRHVMMARGNKKVVPLLGFFEVLIWIIVASQVMKEADNFACYIAWAGGFATGNYVGLILEERIALGLQIIRVICNVDCSGMIMELQSANHGTTVVDASGSKGQVKILFTVAKRKDVPKIISIINKHNPNAFYSIEDVRLASKGVFNPANVSILKRV